MSVDFSKAPEGAKGYIKGSDVTKCEIFIYNLKDKVLWINDSEFTWGDCNYWFPLGLLTTVHRSTLLTNKVSSASIDNSITQTLTITCDNEHQKMLCEHVVRMCRGEASQYERCDGWVDLTGDSDNHKSVYINEVYRAKPKKELVVPWEWLDLDVAAITVNDRGVVLAIDSSNQGWEIKLKLDLTDIELPVTVKRQE